LDGPTTVGLRLQDRNWGAGNPMRLVRFLGGLLGIVGRLHKI
jgi:hypothetical protein